MQYKPVLCSVQFSMCSMCTCSDSGASAGAVAGCNVHCAVSRVQYAEELAVETGWVKIKFYLKGSLQKKPLNL